MKISISNLAWPIEETRNVLEKLLATSVEGIEIAPTKLGHWSSLDHRAFRQYGSVIKDMGFKIPAFQSLFFNLPDAQLLGTKTQFDNFLAHIVRVAEFAAELNVPVLVFGSPKNRLSYGLKRTDTIKLATERFYRVGESLAATGCVLAVESVPKSYGETFLFSYVDAVQIVKRVNHGLIQLHLDIGCIAGNNDDVDRALKLHTEAAAHLHVSQPSVSDFSNPGPYHQDAGTVLKQLKYSGWLGIEMILQKLDIDKILNAVRYVEAMYSENENSSKQPTVIS
jgi:sugar phosphate isomerase/epimerase